MKTSCKKTSNMTIKLGTDWTQFLDCHSEQSEESHPVIARADLSARGNLCKV